MDFQRLTDFLEGLSEKGIPGNSCAVMLDVGIRSVGL